MKNQQIDPDFITITDFERRLYAKHQEKDPLCRKVARSTIRNKMEQGYIQYKEEGGRKFIDWNRYQNFSFGTHARS